MSELVKVDMTEYGLTETKAKEVKQVFDAVLETAEKLEEEYNRIAALEISPEACAEAKVLRLKYVKVRTGIAKAHKEQKAFYLSGGRAVDGLKNAYTHAVQGNEEKLKQIEAHYDRIEEARLVKLQDDRAALLDPYVEDAAGRLLSSLQDDEFAALLAMKKQEHDDRVEAERKAEEDRIAKEKEDAAERLRIAKENEQLKAEAEEREKAEAERARVEAVRIAKEEATRKALEALVAAERAERERIEAEAKAKVDAAAKLDKETKARAKDKEHRRAINNETAEALQAVGLTVEQSQAVVGAIVGGKIANVTLAY